MAEKMTSKKTSKTNTESFFDRFKINMSPEGKSLMLRCLGIAIFLFAAFTLIASVSYLFHWKEDMGVSPDEVANWGGSMGVRWGRFLITNFLGLGSFAFVFLLGVYAVRLFFWKMDVGVVRITLNTFSGAFLCSLLLSLFESGAFQGGLGGYAGQAVVALMTTYMGKLFTVLLVVSLLVVWLAFVSGKFARWFVAVGENVGTKKTAEEPAEEVVEVAAVIEEPEDETFIEDDFDVDVISQPESETEPEIEPEPEVEIELEPEPEVEPEAEPETEPVPAEEESADAAADIEVVRDDQVQNVVVDEELPRIDNREEI